MLYEPSKMITMSRLPRPPHFAKCLLVRNGAASASTNTAMSPIRKSIRRSSSRKILRRGGLLGLRELHRGPVHHVEPLARQQVYDRRDRDRDQPDQHQRVEEPERHVVTAFVVAASGKSPRPGPQARPSESGGSRSASRPLSPSASRRTPGSSSDIRSAAGSDPPAAYGWRFPGFETSSSGDTETPS